MLPTLTEDQTIALFAPYGKLLSVKIARHDDGKSRCFGFVNYEKRSEAQLAVEMMNGYRVGGRTLQVSFKR